MKLLCVVSPPKSEASNGEWIKKTKQQKKNDTQTS